MVNVKLTLKILSVFVAFLENMNFTIKSCRISVKREIQSTFMYFFLGKKKYLTKNSYLVTCDSRSWKGDDDSAIFIANVPENLATSGNKISVMFRIHSHRLLYDLVKICDPGFQFKFGCKVKANTS